MYTNLFSSVDDLLSYASQNNSAYAKTDVRQTEDGYAIDVLLPGFFKEEVTVKAEGDSLVLEAKTKRALPKFLHVNVKKTFQVEDLNAESVSAKLESGILTIEFSTEKKKNARTVRIL
jgi:HSP20 family protein